MALAESFQIYIPPIQLSQCRTTTFSFVLGYEMLNFQELQQNIQRGNEDQRCRERSIAREGLKILRLRWKHNFRSNLLNQCLWSSIFAHKWIHNQRSQNPEQYLLVRVFNSKRVHLVKNRFPFLISILWTNLFNPVTTGGQKLFQSGCFAEECVTVRTTEVLKHCRNIAHLAY